MDLKLELSLKRDADDLKFQLAKDHTGHLFQSKETDTMFILTAHIRGFPSSFQVYQASFFPFCVIYL